MGSYWMRTARRGQLEKAVHFAVLVANSLYWLRAGYVRRLRCRRRRANAWWCRSSMLGACVGYKKRLSQGLSFAVFLILQSSERRLFSKTVFFFQRPFWELPSRASDGSISGTSFARNFFSSDRLSQEYVDGTKRVPG
ncbi:unnamed protein product [Sphagnum troendelagicum]|uniref:Uncharacterized protein n=1 Tax=Sphagnum troendelagicum TaxID=128251 RepID=A0ABP0T7L9_9BRYO